MTIYHYKHSALIDRVDVVSPRPTISQATMLAAENADGHALEDLRKQLGRLGFSTLMDTVDGRAAIQVRGLKSEKIFIDALEKLDLGHDGVAKDLQVVRKDGFGERVRGKSLFLSALFYDIGNVSLGISGIQRGRHNKAGKFTNNDISELMTGATFAVGDVLMSFYGKDKGDEELDAAAQGLKKHLHQKGIKIPEGNELNPDILSQSGVMKATDRWLRKHIGRVKCLTELGGGLFMIHSGLKRDQGTGNINRYKIAAGSLIAAAWATTYLLEKPRGHKIFDGNQDIADDEKQPPHGLIDKIRNNPRAWIAAPLAMSNNVVNILGANKERRDGLTAIAHAQEQVKLHGGAENLANLKFTEAKQHDYLWNVLTACSFLVAHTLFGVSGTERPRETEDDKLIMQDLVLMSANVLEKQPEAIRKASIEETADYVSKLAHVSLSKEQVADAIREKIASLDKSNWVARVQTSPNNGAQVTV